MFARKVQLTSQLKQKGEIQVHKTILENFDCFKNQFQLPRKIFFLQCERWGMFSNMGNILEYSLEQEQSKQFSQCLSVLSN